MDAFVWDQNFITGVEELDAQHHVLVDLFNELSETFYSTDLNCDAVLVDTFARLLAYTKTHFHDEEMLMRDVGIDMRHRKSHAMLHAQFVEQINATWSVRHALPNAAESIMGFLTTWLGLHILGTDQALARQVVAIAAGDSPQTAWEREIDAGASNSQQALLKMIAQLYHVLSGQNASLIEANRHLEQRVAERTQELARSNEELRNANLQLEAFSRTDGLLGVANRAYFEERIAQASASAFRREQPLGLLMIDVDHFKEFNDLHGHPAGDACLQAVAQAVQKSMVRTTDLVARYGGEELAVILPDTDVAGAAVVAAHVVAQVAALDVAHGGSDAAPHVTVSVGVAAHVPSTKDSSAKLVQEADAALYQA
ncbi:MAG: diguanylate cyclase, partial [Giesbergeria sp.]